jgi:hypothetical protein
MSDVKNRWRDFLTPEEADEVARLEAEIATTQPARDRLLVIKSRATQRAIRQRAG